MQHGLQRGRGRLRAPRQVLAGGAAVFGLFVAAPAVSQAVVVSQTTGMAAAGTVSGTWTSGTFNGDSESVAVATVLTCDSFLPPRTSFVANWTDPAGASHTFRFMVSGGNQIGCSFPGQAFASPPDEVTFVGSGSTSATAGAPADNSTVNATLQTPPAFPSSTMQFDLTSPEGTIDIPAQFPGPLQGAPGRIQPFGPPPTGTT